MRIVVQRVSQAAVTVGGETIGNIRKGLLILVGVEHADTAEDALWLAKKAAGLRIFNDEVGLMNLSVAECEGSILVVSQFTLHAQTKKGNRPSFVNSARPEQAIPLYEAFVNNLRKESARPVETGKFGADMKVGLVNDGPVTIIMDSKQRE